MSADIRKPVIVFAGDSVTDCGRRDDPEGLGDGYVRRLAGSSLMAGTAVINRGIAGDRSRDLLARWEADVLSAQPSVVSIMIGINDTWRRYDADDPTSVEAYETNLRRMLDSARNGGIATVLMEPFAVPTGNVKPTWRADLNPKLGIVHSLAAEYEAVLVPLDSCFLEEIRFGLASAQELAPDGVHPGPFGHERIASLWLEYTAELRADLRA